MQVLSGKVVLITGASKGIGAATALEMAKNAASVIVNYNESKEAAHQIVDSIKASGGYAIAVQANVSDEQDVARLFDEAIAEFGKVDVLVNNAGIMFTKPIGQVSTKEFDKMFDVNVKGLFNTLHQASTRLADNGSIINLSSTVTRTIFPGYGPYCATKGAVEQLTRVFAKEIGSRGINVNAVSPGPTETDLFLEGKSQQDIDRLAASNAFNRLGRPEDIARVIVYLASDASKWISGQIIGANGAMA
ncbi:3-oxoacyl-[acyl-carrier protein] reductase [Mucilaginibacter sp. UYP25]|uniref:SDR family oxidoreductase n=1 Tax=unclassified Mucilaginibacter TaxID=2617802 RepID=UPI003393A05F